MLVIVALLLSTVLLVAGSGYVKSRASAAELTNAVLVQATARIQRQVSAQLEVASTQSTLARELFERSALRADDLDGFARYARDVVAAHPSLDYVSFGREADGAFVEAHRLPTGDLRVRFLRRAGAGLELSDYAANTSELRLIRTAPTPNDNEPRHRPWYEAARAARHPVWTETYAFFGDEARLGPPGLTLATPILAADGSLLGVLTADFDLRGTSQFLHDLDLFEHGESFIVEYRRDGTRDVIAHPRPELLLAPAGSAPGLAAIAVERIGDPRVVAFARSLPTTLPTDRAAMVPVAFALDGEDYIGGFRALDTDAVHWIVCALTPEDDVLGQVHANDRISIVFILIGTAGAVLLALYIAARVSRPLRALADETAAIGRFDLALRPPVRYSTFEVGRLAVAVEQMKRNLRSFRKYVPAEVVRELVARGEEATLGGRRERLTIHFSDIAGFTSLAERTSPEALVAMLGEYLDEMTRPILASGGTVDKFIGDAVMAFWGAPRADADHALHACEAALTNRDRLAVLNTAWERAGRPRLDARAALHTGEVIVGNIGSSERLEYTVIGDSVNLASRLEGLNKRYGTSLLISDSTYAMVETVMLARPLDRVSVKGKDAAVEIYELLGRRADASPAAIARVARQTAAFARYLARDFEAAARELRALADDDPADVASRKLAERCDVMIAMPPPADWDGCERLTEK